MTVSFSSFLPSLLNGSASVAALNMSVQFVLAIGTLETTSRDQALERPISLMFLLVACKIAGTFACGVAGWASRTGTVSVGDSGLVSSLDGSDGTCG